MVRREGIDANIVPCKEDVCECARAVPALAWGLRPFCARGRGVGPVSFSLLPWAFIFRLTDHPFALAILQWFWVVGGGVLMAWAAVKRGVPRVTVGGLLVYWVGYHFAQSGVVHEFHGSMLLAFTRIFPGCGSSQRWPPPGQAWWAA